MRTYEALYIIAPNLDDDAIQAVVAGVENLITSNGGTIVRSEVWGRRKLAYEIKKHGEGFYVLLRFGKVRLEDDGYSPEEFRTYKQFNDLLKLACLAIDYEENLICQ